MPAAAGVGVQAAVDDIVFRLPPHAVGGSFLNFLMDPEQTSTAYTTADYRRPVAAKRTWDPDNVLRLNHSIPPA